MAFRKERKIGKGEKKYMRQKRKGLIVFYLNLCFYSWQKIWKKCLNLTDKYIKKQGNKKKVWIFLVCYSSLFCHMSTVVRQFNIKKQVELMVILIDSIHKYLGFHCTNRITVGWRLLNISFKTFFQVNRLFKFTNFYSSFYYWWGVRPISLVGWEIHIFIISLFSFLIIWVIHFCFFAVEACKWYFFFVILSFWLCSVMEYDEGLLLFEATMDLRTFLYIVDTLDVSEWFSSHV